jgi:hypothetical protein
MITTTNKAMVWVPSVTLYMYLKRSLNHDSSRMYVCAFPTFLKWVRLCREDVVQRRLFTNFGDFVELYPAVIAGILQLQLLGRP